MKHKKISLFIIVGFLSVQMLTYLHTAQYGFEKHDHHGYVCQIYLQSEHTKYNTSGAALLLQVATYLSFAIILFQFVFVSSTNYRGASPRAPPVFS